MLTANAYAAEMIEYLVILALSTHKGISQWLKINIFICINRMSQCSTDT